MPGNHLDSQHTRKQFIDIRFLFSALVTFFFLSNIIIANRLLPIGRPLNSEELSILRWFFSFWMNEAQKFAVKTFDQGIEHTIRYSKEELPQITPFTSQTIDLDGSNFTSAFFAYRISVLKDLLPTMPKVELIKQFQYFRKLIQSREISPADYFRALESLAEFLETRNFLGINVLYRVIQKEAQRLINWCGERQHKSLMLQFFESEIQKLFIWLNGPREKNFYVSDFLETLHFYRSFVHPHLYDARLRSFREIVDTEYKKNKTKLTGESYSSKMQEFEDVLNENETYIRKFRKGKLGEFPWVKPYEHKIIKTTYVQAIVSNLYRIGRFAKSNPLLAITSGMLLQAQLGLTKSILKRDFKGKLIDDKNTYEQKERAKRGLFNNPYASTSELMVSASGSRAFGIAALPTEWVAAWAVQSGSFQPENIVNCQVIENTWNLGDHVSFGNGTHPGSSIFGAANQNSYAILYNATNSLVAQQVDFSGNLIGQYQLNTTGSGCFAAQGIESLDNNYVILGSYYSNCNSPAQGYAFTQLLDPFMRPISSSFGRFSNSTAQYYFTAGMTKLSNDKVVVVVLADSNLRGQVLSSTGSSVSQIFQKNQVSPIPSKALQLSTASFGSDSFLVTAGTYRQILNFVFNQSGNVTAESYMFMPSFSGTDNIGFSNNAGLSENIAAIAYIKEITVNQYALFGQILNSTLGNLGDEFQISKLIYPDDGFNLVPKILLRRLSTGNLAALYSVYYEQSDSNLYARSFRPTLLISYQDQIRSYVEGQNCLLTDVTFLEPIYKQNFKDFRVTFTLTPKDAGSFLTYSPSALAKADFNATLGTWTLSGYAAGVNELLSGAQFVPINQYYNGNLSVSLEAYDGIGPTYNDVIYLIGIPVENPPLVLNAIPSQLAKVGGNFNFCFDPNTFFDPDQQGLSYSAEQPNNATLPGWLSFDSTTRCFSSITPPTKDDIAFNQIIVTANDGHGGEAATTMDLAILPWLFATNLDGNFEYPQDTLFFFPQAQAIVIQTAAPRATVNMTLLEPEGSISQTTVGSATSLFNSQQSVWTVTGLVEDVNAMMANLSYVPKKGSYASFQIKVVVGDGYNNNLLGTITLRGIPSPAGPTSSNQKKIIIAAVLGPVALLTAFGVFCGVRQCKKNQRHARERRNHLLSYYVRKELKNLDISVADDFLSPEGQRFVTAIQRIETMLRDKRIEAKPNAEDGNEDMKQLAFEIATAINTIVRPDHGFFSTGINPGAINNNAKRIADKVAENDTTQDPKPERFVEFGAATSSNAAGNTSLLSPLLPSGDNDKREVDNNKIFAL